MSYENVTKSLLLPELEFVSEKWIRKVRLVNCLKVSEFEIGPHCATKSSSIYDHRYVRPRD